MTKKAVCFGEVLWDVFPDRARIGGAPLNVASRLSNLGLETEVISQIGDDVRGEMIISYLQEQKIGTTNIVIDKLYSTGTVKVTLSPDGSASYEIAYPAAWDHIRLTDENLNAVEESSVFIFGSLACRNEVSRKTLFQLLPKAKFKALDFNLRAPHYTSELILALIKEADLIKFNDDELSEIATLLGSPYNSIEQNMSFIALSTSSSSICVTKGRHGAVLLHEGLWYHNSGYHIEVRDTVGAGDSFLATLLANLLSGTEVQRCLDLACAVGSLVAGQEGANPEITEEMVKEFMFPGGEQLSSTSTNSS